MFFAKIMLVANGIFIASFVRGDEDLPKFGDPIQNVTVSIGRDAVLICTVDNLQTYKIAWLRVDTQTILTIQNHVITKNHRMSVTHAEKRQWVLKIKEVKETDKGWYMCQINTDPMKNQVGYLDVVVPPDILDYPTSTDMVVREGANVTLKCAARGSPTPTITWRREGGELITLPNGETVSSYNGSTLTMEKVGRLNMGAYLCIASNGIPPTISKRVMLIVHFPPMISVQNQLVGASLSQTVTLDCHSEAFPKSINYWMYKKIIITQSDRFEPTIYENDYRVVMRLTIKNVDMHDFGSYSCVAKNSLGDTDGVIKLYHIPRSTILTTLPPTTALTILTTAISKDNSEEKSILYKSTADAILVGVNKIFIGSTSDSWNSDGRERDNRHKYDGNGGVGGSDQQKDSENEVLYDASGTPKLFIVLRTTLIVFTTLQLVCLKSLHLL